MVAKEKWNAVTYLKKEVEIMLLLKHENIKPIITHGLMNNTNTGKS
jgi:hypothetical protein